MRTSLGININLAEYMSRNGHLKEYIFYTKLRSLYNHTIIYNFNYNKLSKLIGLSHKTCERYTKKLFQYGLAEIRDGHLHLINEKKVWSKISETKPVRRTIEVRPWTSYKGICQRLQCLLLKENAKQQEFNSIKKFGNQYRKTYLDGKNKAKALKLHRVNSAEKTEKCCYNSSKQIGKLLGCSHTTALKIVHKLAQKKYLKFEQSIRQVRMKLPKDLFKKSEFILGLNLNNPGFFFLKNNILYHHSGLDITYLPI